MPNTKTLRAARTVTDRARHECAARRPGLPSLIGLPAAAALLCSAAFPPFDLWPLAWFGLIPLVHALSRERGMRSFCAGWLFGGLHGLTLTYWVFNALYFHTDVGFLVSALFVLLAVGVGMGLYYAMFGWLAARVLQSGRAAYVQTAAVAASWVGVELLRAHLFSGVPWDLFGYSQYRFLPIIQIADTTGVYGISFLLVFTNCSLYRAWGALPDRRRAAVLAAPALALVACCLAYGAVRLHEVPEAPPTGAEGTVAIVQLNVQQDDRWKAETQDAQLAAYLRQSNRAVQRGARLLIWPEAATQAYFQEGLSRGLVDLLSGHAAELVVGAPRYTGDPGAYRFYNSAFLLNGRGIARVQDKLHLLPFGEYFPLGIIDVLRLEYAGPRQYSPGRDYTIFETLAGRLGVLVCFEIIFPDIAREFVRRGAGLLVNISNDAWFGRTSAHYQHFSMAVLRAVELRRPVLRASNTGISGHIDAAGRILSRLAPFTEGVIVCSPKPGSGQTPYCRIGDAFAWLCAGLAATALLFRHRRNTGA